MERIFHFLLSLGILLAGLRAGAHVGDKSVLKCRFSGAGVVPTVDAIRKYTKEVVSFNKQRGEYLVVVTLADEAGKTIRENRHSVQADQLSNRENLRTVIERCGKTDKSYKMMGNVKVAAGTFKACRVHHLQTKIKETRLIAEVPFADLQYGSRNTLNPAEAESCELESFNWGADASTATTATL